MQITWYGQSFFEIKIKNEEKDLLSLTIDPFDESLGLKVPKIKSQILLITHSHPDHSNIKAIKGEPFLIEEPGEYEVKEVFVKGILSFHDNLQGKERGTNVIYKIKAEEMNLCHLGDLGQKELSSEQLEEIGQVDILMIPVGGVYTIDAKVAASIVSQIEPKIVIPMHYKIPRLKLKLESSDKFLKIIGAEKVQPQKNLKIKSKDLTKEEIQIVVLTQ